MDCERLLARRSVSQPSATAAPASRSGKQSPFRPDAGNPLCAACVDSAIHYLGAQGQAEDGSFSARAGLGVTALVASAVLRHGRNISDPLVAKSLEYLGRFVHVDGGIHSGAGVQANYETALAIMCLREANADRRYSGAIRRAEVFLRRHPWDEWRRELNGSPSIDYSGLKSMLAAGLGADPPRVESAVAWICQTYDLHANPGQGDACLYYYYHTFAKTLHALGGATCTDAAGVEHDWRRELIDRLRRSQQHNGAWINGNGRWMEDDPNLATAHALLALSYC